MKLQFITSSLFMGLALAGPAPLRKHRAVTLTSEVYAPAPTTPLSSKFSAPGTGTVVSGMSSSIHAASLNSSFVWPTLKTGSSSTATPNYPKDSASVVTTTVVVTTTLAASTESASSATSITEKSSVSFPPICSYVGTIYTCPTPKGSSTLPLPTASSSVSASSYGPSVKSTSALQTSSVSVGTIIPSHSSFTWLHPSFSFNRSHSFHWSTAKPRTSAPASKTVLTTVLTTAITTAITTVNTFTDAVPTSFSELSSAYSPPVADSSVSFTDKVITLPSVTPSATSHTDLESFPGVSSVSQTSPVKSETSSHFSLPPPYTTTEGIASSLATTSSAKSTYAV